MHWKRYFRRLSLALKLADAVLVTSLLLLYRKLDGKYSERVQLPAKVCPMVLLTWGHFGI